MRKWCHGVTNHANHNRCTKVSEHFEKLQKSTAIDRKYSKFHGVIGPWPSYVSWYMTHGTSYVSLGQPMSHSLWDLDHRSQKCRSLINQSYKTRLVLTPFTFDVRPFSSFGRNKLYLSLKTMDQPLGSKWLLTFVWSLKPVTVKSGEVYLNINLNISKWAR